MRRCARCPLLRPGRWILVAPLPTWRPFFRRWNRCPRRPSRWWCWPAATGPEAAAELELSERDLARALADARTALRRSVRPLAGSGWCGRAEALVSDRLDGVLDDAGAARLDVHLRNCPRCVEHERRLIQGQNGLVGAFGRAPADAEPAELTLVRPVEPAEPVDPQSLASIVAVSAGVLIVLSALLVIAAIAFALVALLGL